MKKVVIFIVNLLIISKLSFSQSVTLAPTNPASPTKGTVVFDNALNQLKYWNGTTYIPITNAAAATGWGLAGSNLYASNNVTNVGIGTTTPAYKLSVSTPSGNWGMTHTDGNALLGSFIYSNNTYGHQTDGWAEFGTRTNNPFALFANNQDLPPAILIDKNGLNVGISTLNPVNTFQVGDVPSTFTGYNLTFGNSTNASGLSQAATVATWNSTTNISLMPQNGNSNGFVGIGTTAPTYALDVRGGAVYYPASNGNQAGNYFNFQTNYENAYGTIDGLLSFTTYPYGFPITIYGEYGVRSLYFVASSDARIKNIIGKSNSAEDLTTLNKIQITDYTMKDVVQFGNKTFKKIIAQEVEKVYPQAVSQEINVVPDIYALAEKVVFDENKKEITISLLNNYDIKIGEKIEFIHPEKGKIKAEVVAVSGNSFTVKDWQFPTDKIFVFGREVNDFRSVDYEAISMLGISAIQELSKQNEELRIKNDELEKKLEKQKLEFSNRLEKIEALLSKPNQ